MAEPDPTHQVNLTDEESRIMPVPGGGFEHCYNAQAAGSLLVVAKDVVQAANDKQQIAPMLGKLCALPEELGEFETLLADTGYFSEANVEACVAVEVDPPHGCLHPGSTSSWKTEGTRDYAMYGVPTPIGAPSD